MLWTTGGADSPWPMFRHDGHHTGRTPYTGPAVPSVQWVFEASDGIASSPAIGHDGTIYVGVGWDYRGAINPGLVALNPDGNRKWHFNTNGSVFSSPAVGPDGTIYFGSLDKYYYAVEDSITYGKRKWKTSLGHWIYTSPAIGPDGTTYMGSVNSKVYAVDQYGAIKWTYQTLWCVFSSAAIGPDGLIYIGSKDHNVYAFEDHTTQGTVHWKFETGRFYDGHLVDSSPAIGPDGTIYVGTDPYGASGHPPVPVTTVFIAINPDGSLKWTFDMDDGTESSPAIGPDGTIYVGSYDGHLYAIRDEGERGLLQWRFPTGGWIDGSPVVDGCGTIYVGSRDSTLYAIHPDGTLRWSFPTGGEIESSPTIDDKGIVYIGTFSGDVYALGNGGPDVGVVSIQLPGEVPANTDFSPTARVRNYRSGPQGFKVLCRIDTTGSVLYEDSTYVSALPETTSMQVTFGSWRVSSDTGAVYKLAVMTSLVGDNNWYNDTVTVQLNITSQGVGITNGSGQREHPHFALYQCTPNPFNAETQIRYRISDQPSPTRTLLKIYNVLGQEVGTLVDETQGVGSYTVSWDGRDMNGCALPSGVYVYRLESASFSDTRKMILLR
jgi:outer membrane protein assembly factor BamB